MHWPQCINVLSPVGLILIVSNSSACSAHVTLKLNSKHNWQFLTTSILHVLKSFMKNLLTVKSSEETSDLVRRMTQGHIGLLLLSYITLWMKIVYLLRSTLLLCTADHNSLCLSFRWDNLSNWGTEEPEMTGWRQRASLPASATLMSFSSCSLHITSKSLHRPIMSAVFCIRKEKETTRKTAVDEES